MVPLFCAAYADLSLQKTMLNSLANGKIQGLFKAFECFPSTFQGKFYFQGLFKTVLYIQVLFKPVRNPIKSLCVLIMSNISFNICFGCSKELFH